MPTAVRSLPGDNWGVGVAACLHDVMTDNLPVRLGSGPSQILGPAYVSYAEGQDACTGEHREEQDGERLAVPSDVVHDKRYARHPHRVPVVPLRPKSAIW